MRFHTAITCPTPTTLSNSYWLISKLCTWRFFLQKLGKLTIINYCPFGRTLNQFHYLQFFGEIFWNCSLTLCIIYMFENPGNVFIKYTRSHLATAVKNNSNPVDKRWRAKINRGDFKHQRSIVDYPGGCPLISCVNYTRRATYFCHVLLFPSVAGTLHRGWSNQQEDRK